MSNNKIRIRLKAYDHRVLDTAFGKILETVKRTFADWTQQITPSHFIEKTMVLFEEQFRGEES